MNDYFNFDRKEKSSNVLLENNKNKDSSLRNKEYGIK